MTCAGRTLYAKRCLFWTAAGVTAAADFAYWRSVVLAGLIMAFMFAAGSVLLAKERERQKKLRQINSGALEALAKIRS